MTKAKSDYEREALALAAESARHMLDRRRGEVDNLTAELFHAQANLEVAEARYAALKEYDG